MNKRLSLILRGIMGSYAVRWNKIHLDPQQQAHARWLLEQAVRIREKSKQMERKL